MSDIRVGLILVLSAVLSAPCGAERLYPRDEARKDPSFFAFRRRLQEIVRKKDREALRRLLDPKIEVDFGGGQGIAAFEEHWNLRSGRSKLWATLADVLSHGGEFYGRGTGRGFAAPYTSSAFPDELDPFDHLCVVGARVALRARPEERAPVVARLTYEIVRLDPASRNAYAEHAPWIGVTVPGGRSGYLPRRLVRSPIDYRALFEKRRGQWRLTAFVAGD